MGDDEWGNKYRDNLEKLNIDSNFVGTASGKTTGLAQINVSECGENQIVIIPGANDLLTSADVEKAQNALDSSKVIAKLYTFQKSISVLNEQIS